MQKGTGASRDPRERLAARNRLVRPLQELSEGRREKKEQRALQALVTPESKGIVGHLDPQDLLELQVPQLRWCDWETVLLCRKYLDQRGLLGFRARMGLQGHQGQMENQEIQVKMEKLANRVLEVLLGAKAAPEPKDRRESAERGRQDLGGLQDYLGLQGPAVGINLHSWTWRDLDLQTWTNSGVLVVLQASQGPLVLLEHLWPLMPMVQLPLDLQDPLDWMGHRAFLVPQALLEQQVNLAPEDRRETVGI